MHFTQPVIHYLPVATTILSICFGIVIFRRYLMKGGGNHLLWWSLGVFVYGLGTASEAYFTLWGWSNAVFRIWYIVGALMGGVLLAQGTIWLLLKRKTALWLSIVLVVVLTIASWCVLASPLNLSLANPHLPSGAVLTWQWVRYFSPFINTYALVFLVGGALYSAWKFYTLATNQGAKQEYFKDKYIGNIFIAVGALLPGFGGLSSRFGHTEILYLTEISGLFLIWIGYWFNIRRRPFQSFNKPN
ncbi:MAG: hypothetical protein ACE5D2_01260 [Fidelibacterota bacterium]